MSRAVALKPPRVIRDEDARLMEMLPSDGEIFKGFGRLSVSAPDPGVGKAWPRRRKRRDHSVVVARMMEKPW